MDSAHTDITRRLITQEYLYSNLGSLFPDSVFLSPTFKILGLSVNVQQTLGYTCEDVCGSSISCLEQSGTLEEKIRLRLREGFFANEEIAITKKTGGHHRYSISGFYLGLISDLSGTIVLKFSNQEEIATLNQQLLLTKAQIDNFIYRTAHDIRGPLATIQGLTNLLKMREDDSEVDRFVDLIDSHSKQLDERLTQLVYLAHVDEEEISPVFEVDFHDMETHLRKVIEQNAFVDFLELNFVARSGKLRGINELLLMKMLTNLTLGLLSLPKKSLSSQIMVNCTADAGWLTIRMKTVGFIFDQSTQNGVNQGGSSMYTDILKFSKLIHFFAAQKIASKLKATIHVKANILEEQFLTISMPVG